MGATPDNASAEQTLTVTLAMPDGSALPQGRISIAGWVQARGTSWPWLRLFNGSCAGGPQHTGSTHWSTSATVTSIT